MSDDLFGPEHRDRLLPRLELLQRKLEVSPDHLAAAVGRKPPGAVEFVPFYSLYKVCRDYADGDDPSPVDLVLATADLATALAPVGKLAVVAGKSGKQVPAGVAARELVVKEAEQAVRQRVGADAAARFGGVVANRFAARVAAKRLLAQAIGRFKAELSRRELRVETRSDVTEVFRYVYRRTGRDPFRPLTGLEPRVFLTGEARLELHLAWSSEVVLRRQKGLAALRELAKRATGPGVGVGPDSDTSPLGGVRSGPVRDGGGPGRLGALLWLAAAADLLSPADPDPRP